MQRWQAPLQQHLQRIPQALSMAIQVAELSSDHLCLHAPLAPNINDKGSAFGGSQASLLTLAGWGLVTARLWQAGWQGDVYVAESHIHYLTPLGGALEARAEAADPDAWQPFLQRLQQKGRASIALSIHMPTQDGRSAARMQARFVAFAHR